MMICTATPTLTTVEQLQSALRSSCLLSATELERLNELTCVDTLDGHSWALSLVANGILTEYQVEQLLAGKGETLVLGQYRILDKLGAGGMGQVYKAEHRLMRRLVALKVIVPHLVRDASAVARFHDEVQVAAQLAHPNIVTAFDADEANGLHFLVMEYIEGIDLSRLIEHEGPLPVPQACEYIRQAALGLQHAHEHGLVHCDIKPSNLLLRQSVTLCGTPQPALIKILDFGLAQLIGAPGTKSTVVTLSGLGNDFAGTPDYMAPEQAHDYEAADIRSDLYSLGCTFFYLLTGQVPYHGGTWSEKLLRHQFDPPPAVTAMRPDVPEEVAVLVQRLMAKEPAERFQTPAELENALFESLSRQCQSGEFLFMPVSADVKSRYSLERLVLPGPAAPAPAVASPTQPTSLAGSDQRAAGVTPAVPYPTRPGRRWLWPSAVMAAIATGLLIAWGARSIALQPPAAPTPAELSRGITLERSPNRIFLHLDTAIAAARDGDTLILHGNGSYPTEPLAIFGKSLTLTAALGCRPRIELLPHGRHGDWEALIECDRPLLLHGLELCAPHHSISYLVYARQAPLRLVDCHLLAPHGRALVVCRKAPSLEMRDCVVVADASAICIEVGGGRACQITLSQTQITLGDRRAAALCLWSGSTAAATRVDLQLQQNEIDSGRVLSLCGLGGGLQVNAVDNQFHFYQAVLSCTADSAGRTWRDHLRWDGKQNTYRGPACWLSVNETSAGVSGLRSWREFWHSAEANSREQTETLSVQPAQPAQLE
jgi:serine/threonine protein kinase